MPVLPQNLMFPLIADAIRVLWDPKKGGWVTREEIAAPLLANAAVSERLVQANKPARHVENAIDWFSQKYTSGQSAYIEQFERAKIDGKWAYRPAQSERRSYQKHEQVGQGGFGAVYRGELLINGVPRKTVAIKSYYGEFDENEYALLKTLDHPYIIRLLDRYQDIDLRGHLQDCLVLEYADGGSLADRLRVAKDGLSAPEVWRMVGNVAEALVYLHTREPRIIHRDIKPKNILFCKGVAKLSDVGISKLIDKTTVTQTVGRFTEAFVAPEMLPVDPSKKPVVSPKADIYALGLTAFEALAGERPWKDAILWHHYHGELPSHPRITAGEYKALLAMTTKRYQDRWSAERVVEAARVLERRSRLRPVAAIPRG